MILAVYVIRDSSSDRHRGCPRHDRKKPTGRHRQLQDICQQDAGFASDKSCVAIGGDESVQGACQQQRSTRVETAVAVTAAVTVGQDGGTGGNSWKLSVAAS